MERHIYLQVCAGLANRLRATVSGIRAAEELGCGITISWPKEAVFGATWSDLFERGDLPTWIQFTDTPIKGAKICLTADEFAAAAALPGDIRIKSYGCFRPLDTQWLRRLKPRPEFLPTFGSPVGVHIRRTDNIASILNSPTPAFHAAIAALPATKLFLATDDPKERTAFIYSYPGRVVTLPTECYHRDLKEGIEQGFREFLGLAACSEILGSVGSSFSELAAAYGGVPLRLISLNK